MRSNVASASIDGYCPIEDCGIVKDSVLLLSLRRLWSAGGSSTSALMMRKNLKGMVVIVGIGRRWVVGVMYLGCAGGIRWRYVCGHQTGCIYEFRVLSGKERHPKEITGSI